MFAAKTYSDQKKEERDRWLAAQTQRLSPWTGLKANPIEEADALGNAMQTYGTYQGMEQAEENAAAQKKLQEAQINYLNRGNQSGIGLDANQAGEPRDFRKQFSPYSYANKKSYVEG